MFRRLTSLAAVMLVLLSLQANGAEPGKATTLGNAVEEFNQRAQKNRTGMDQPPLTEEEVIASIRGWDREQTPATDDVYKAYQTIADTKKLPEDAKLKFTTGWRGFNGHDFDVWWVDLDIKTGPNSGYTYRIRDRKLRCRPSGQ